MTVDSVITLENNVNCLLLECVRYEDNNYFMAVVLNEDEEPTEDYVIFKEIIENNENYVEKVENAKTLSELLKLFTKNVNKFVDTLPNTF